MHHTNMLYYSFNCNLYRWKAFWNAGKITPTLAGGSVGFLKRGSISLF
ncbi:MAG: hypothetical protein ACFFEN_01390 [Candidatus Thorarchaeota archaeon]